MVRLRVLIVCLAVSARIAIAAELGVPGDYATIQAAIDAAAPGDTVLLESGTYTESISLRSDVTVRGEETARTLLRAEGTGPAVTADGVSGARLANLTIIDSGVGVRIVASADITLASLVLDGLTSFAVDVDTSPGLEIANCVFNGNAAAVRLLADDAHLVNNLFTGNTATVSRPTGVLGDIEFNGFFANDDLRQGTVDTALGRDFTIGDPLYVDPDARDFHLRVDSPAIDAGTGTDVIDDSVADLGAWGGGEADLRPYPVAGVTLTDASGGGQYAIEVAWQPNLAYLVDNPAAPGDYRVYYRRESAGPPYDGTDAGGGTQSSPIDVGNLARFVLDELSPATSTPSVPVLERAESRDQAVRLVWTAASGATGYRIGYGVAATGEHALEVGDVTEATVTGLVNGTTYLFAVAALRQPRYHVAVTVRDGTPDHNESDLSDDAVLAVGKPTVSAASAPLSAAPAITTPVPDLPDKGCFIATAAWGAAWQPQVAILRDFRDRFLIPNPAGRTFVRWYYRNGPAAARVLSEHPAFRPLVRAALWPLVLGALLALAASPLTVVMVGAAGAALAGIAAHRRRRLRMEVGR